MAIRPLATYFSNSHCRQYFQRGGGDGKRTELNNNLPEIIWMSRYFEETNITHCMSIVVLSELVFLYVTHALHYKTNDEQNHTSDIAARTKVMLRVLRHVGGV